MEYIKSEIEKLNIEKKLKDILFIDNTKEMSIKWGMNYILFSPSKRIRPLLLLESNLVFSEIDEDSYILSSIVELIHTYSLVHDDLPSMDDDDMRRGLKTLHKLKNEAYAILVGDALLTRAFGMLSKYSKPEKINIILELLNKKSGADGMIKGQVLDLDGEGKELDIEQINSINKYKTASLIELSLMLGAINGGANNDDLKKIENFGTIIGHIFQLQDDILDIIGDDEVLGKNTGSDQKNLKSSLPIVLGLEKAKLLLNEYKNSTSDYLNGLKANKRFFEELLLYLINRVK